MRQITIPDDGWTLYPNRGKGGRSIGGKFVTITPVGNLTISAELTRDIPREKPYLRIEYNPVRKMMRLNPSVCAVDGSLKIMMPSKGRGVSARVGTAGGFKLLDLVPKKSASYQAEWLGGSIIVDLTMLFSFAVADPPPFQVSAAPREEKQLVDISNRPGPADGPLNDLAESRDEDAAVEAECGNCYYHIDGLCTQTSNRNYGLRMDDDDCCVRHALKPPGFGRDLPEDLRPRVKRTCETCLHRSHAGLCRNEAGPKANTYVGAADRCDQHVFRDPTAIRAASEREAAPKKPWPRQGSRPRAACPECGHTIPVSAKGLMPHDTEGMIFTGRCGDRDKRCDGSNKQIHHRDTESTE
ncbi:MAG: hypothetical protein ABFE01_20755 [Phycisphaerales bacterium]